MNKLIFLAMLMAAPFSFAQNGVSESVGEQTSNASRFGDTLEP